MSRLRLVSFSTFVRSTFGGPARRALLVALVALVAFSGVSRADVTSSDVTLTAPAVARRQEAALPAVSPSSVTITVTGGASGRSIDSASLSFVIGRQNVTNQYTVTAPTFPVAVAASGSQALSFAVTPKTLAAPYATVDITATIQATDTGGSSSATATKTTTWTVEPGSSVHVGQFDGTSILQLVLGMNSPAAIATDGTRLFVADTSNHRVLIWNTIPTANQTRADVVLGQPGYLSALANNGLTTPTASTLNAPQGVICDGTKLYVSDTGNNRVLIWNTVPSADNVAADVVLGQADFVSNQSNRGFNQFNDPRTANRLSSPLGLYVSGTKLFVADSNNNRVLIFNAIPTTNGADADVVLGQTSMTGFITNQGGAFPAAATLNRPGAVHSDGTKLYVADTSNHRVLIWNAVPTTNNAASDVVVGQPDFNSVCNFGCRGAFFLSSPAGLFSDGTKLLIADSGNNRILVHNSIPTANFRSADVVLGQSDFNTAFSGGSTSNSAFRLAGTKGIALAGTKVLVADSSAHRVLIFNTVPTANFTAANLELGQPDFSTGQANFVGVTSSVLGNARHVSSDGTRLFVTDSTYHRVLIFNTLPRTDKAAADVVLGQADFAGSLVNRINSLTVGAGTLFSPSCAFSDGTRLFVVDSGNNRVLIWNTIPTTNGKDADVVLGQTSFTTRLATTANASSLFGPIAVFSDGTRLFVCDSGAGRILIWNSIPTANGQAADLVIGKTSFTSSNSSVINAAALFNPQGVFSDGTRLFVSDLSVNRVLIWNKIPTSIGQAADVVVGKPDFTTISVSGNPVNAFNLSSPTGVLSDGTRLFVVEPNNHRVLVWDDIPEANGLPATGVIGQTSFTSRLQSVSNYGLNSPAAIGKSGDTLWVADNASLRVLGYYLPLRAALTFSRANRAYRVEPFAVTASFSQDISPSAPKIAISGPGGANDITPTAMTPGPDLKTWTYATTLAGGSDGISTVTLDATDTFGIPLPEQPVRNNFLIDTVVPTVTQLTFDKGPAYLPAGTVTITADTSERLETPPALVFSGPAATSGRFSGGNTFSSPTTISPTRFVYSVSITGTTPTLGEDYTATFDGAKDLAGNTQLVAETRSGIVDSNPPLAPVLSFSKVPAAIGSGAFSITADYSEPLGTTPTLTFSGASATNGRFAGGNVLSIPTRISSTQFVFNTTVTGASSQAGDAYVATVAGGADFAGNVPIAPTAQSGIVDTVPPGAPALTFDKDPLILDAGTVTVTADYAEPIDATPTLAFSGVAANSARFVGGNSFSSPTRLSATSFVFTFTVATLTLPGSDAYLASVNGATDLAGNKQTSGAFQAGTVESAFLFAPTLSFSRDPAALAAGLLAVTASYSRPIATTPTLTFSGAAATAGRFGANPVFSSPVRLSTSDFLFTVSIAGTTAQAGEAYSASVDGAVDLRSAVQKSPASQSGVIDTVAPVPTLTFSQSSTSVGAGKLTITATFNEPLVRSLPTIAISRSGGGNDLTDSPMKATSDPSVWTFDYSVLPPVRSDLVDGPATVVILGGKDAAGNSSGPALNSTFTVASALSLAVIRTQNLNGGPQIFDLDGSSSQATGTGNSIVSYSWALTSRPAGATAFTSQTVRILYPAKTAGTYVFALTVTDKRGTTNTAGLSIDVSNVAPVVTLGPKINAVLPRTGLSASVASTTVVTLDGRGASDANGDAVTYAWTVVAAPDRSVEAADTTTLVTFDSRTTAQLVIRLRTDLVSSTRTRAQLVAAGAYKFRLTVSDGKLQSFSEQTVIVQDPLSLQPAANAGVSALYQVSFLPQGGISATVPDPTVRPPVDASGTALNLRAFVRLDAHESADPNGKDVTYRWTVAKDPMGKLLVPAGSLIAAVSDPTGVAPTFVPDKEGVYVFELVVNNQIIDSDPARVAITIATTNHPPSSAPLAEDLVTLRFAGPLDARLSFKVGDRVTLDARNSTDPDEQDRTSLVYAWSQISGPSVSLMPSSTSAVVSFLSGTAGSYKFQLGVTDSHGLSGSPVAIELVVLKAGQDAPKLSLGSTANTTTAKGADQGDALADGSPDSLRVTIPTTVTLAATLSSLPAGQRYRLDWSQLEGPTVILSNAGEANTASLTSLTSFTPTTSRVHVFMASIELLDSLGAPTGLGTSKKISVIVDRPGSRVPTAAGVLSPSLVPSAGSSDERRVTLDGRPSLTASQLAAGSTLLFVWEQLEGPPVVIENPSSPLTFFTMPSFSDSMVRTYRFALYVDSGLDRSQLFALTATQSPGAVAGAPGGSGVNCGLGDPLLPGRASNLLMLLLPLAVVAGSARRRARRQGAGSSRKTETL